MQWNSDTLLFNGIFGAFDSNALFCPERRFSFVFLHLSVLHHHPHWRAPNVMFMRICFEGMHEKSSADEVIMSNQGEGETMLTFSEANKLPDLLQIYTKLP